MHVCECMCLSVRSFFFCLYVFAHERWADVVCAWSFRWKEGEGWWIRWGWRTAVLLSICRFWWELGDSRYAATLWTRYGALAIVSSRIVTTHTIVVVMLVAVILYYAVLLIRFGIGGECCNGLGVRFIYMYWKLSTSQGRRFSNWQAKTHPASGLSTL